MVKNLRGKADKAILAGAQDLFCAFQGGAAGGEGSAVTFIKIHQFYSHTIAGLLAKLAGDTTAAEKLNGADAVAVCAVCHCVSLR